MNEKRWSETEERERAMQMAGEWKRCTQREKKKTEKMEQIEGKGATPAM